MAHLALHNTADFYKFCHLNSPKRTALDVRMDSTLECCVSGCHTRPNQGFRFYRFPSHNPQISSIWKQRIYQSANIGFDVLNDHVCELHFDYRCKTGNECALEEGSLPTLHLPGDPFSADNAHFQMSADRIEEPSYTISIDTLSYHCRFCLRRGLLYEIETSTYRNESFSFLIDLPSNVLPDNTQPNVCLSCLKSILIAHRLSMAVEHSNTILQLLLQHPKQCKVVSDTNFFDMKSELAFCNLILANSLTIKLEIEDNMVWVNDDYEQKWVGTGEPTSSAAYVNNQNMVEKQDNVSKMHNLATSDKQCQKEFYKSFEVKAECTSDLNTEGTTASENDSCLLMENADDNAETIVSNNSDDSCASGRPFHYDQAPESTSKSVNEPIWQRKSFTLADENTNWNENDGVYICSICDWKNPSFHTFNVHMSGHNRSDKNSVIESEELETLEIDPVRNADGRYQCTVCPKTFSRKSHFSEHKIIHTQDRPYKCTECSKTFTRKSSLDIHQRVHTNERPYKCAECSKAFSHKSALRVHTRIHTNERPYKCTECSKTFSTKSSLDKHNIIHTNERSFKCTICLKTFSQKGNFIRHKRIHTHERPFKCTECPKTFSDQSHLSRHKIIHTTEGPPYKCTECPITFSTKGSLAMHKRIHTDDLINLMDAQKLLLDRVA